MMECVEYFSGLWEERRKRPEGNDLVSMLVHGEATKHMAAADHLGNLLLLIVGGNDTTRNTMSGSVYALNQFPEQYDKLTADPGLVPEAGARDHSLADTALLHAKDGDPRLRARLASRSESTTSCSCGTCPATATRMSSRTRMLSISNAPTQDVHLSFGHGTHFCMGSRLAELGGTESYPLILCEGLYPLAGHGDAQVMRQVALCSVGSGIQSAESQGLARRSGGWRLGLGPTQFGRGFDSRRLHH